MKPLKISLILFVFFLSGGCASKYAITYNSEPAGATVICNGINQGYTPVTLYYELNENNKKQKLLHTAPCTAIWSSGVKSVFCNTWDLNKFPDGVMQTLPRPTGEGYSQDAEFALKLQQMRNAQSAANARAFAKSAEDFNKSMQNLNQSMQYNYQLQQLNNNLFMMRMGY